jgi:hypothetical protein
MARPLRILTFGWQPDHLRLLAAAGHRWDVVPRIRAHCARPWALARLLPNSANVVTLETARARLQRNTYDRILCLAPPDLRETASISAPALMLLTRPFEAFEAVGWTRHTVEVEIAARLQGIPLLYLNSGVRDSWGLPGSVLNLGLDLAQYPKYDGRRPEICVTGRMLNELPIPNGTAAIEAAVAGMPFVLCDSGEHVPGFQAPLTPARRWDRCRSARAFFWSVPYPYADASDPLVLEALAIGSPVVSTPQPGSLLVDGMTGYVSSDVLELRARLRDLLGNLELARLLGAVGRDRVRTLHPFEPFVRQWNDVLCAASARHAHALLSSVTPAIG